MTFLQRNIIHPTAVRILGVAGLLLLALAIAKFELYRASPQLTEIALLPLANRTSEPALDFWSITPEFFLAENLFALHSIKAAQGVNWARQRLNLKCVAAVTDDQAIAIASLIGASNIINGDYQRTNGQWVVTMRILSPKPRNPTRMIEAKGGDWAEIHRSLVQQIATAVGVKLNSAERAQIRKPLTSSSAAMESLARACFESVRGSSESKIEQEVRAAVTADDRCSYASAYLARLEARRGNLKQAQELVRRALKLNPNDSNARYVAGILGTNSPSAEQDLILAAHLAPYKTEALETLAELHLLRGDIAGERHYLQSAALRNPFSWNVRVALAEALIRLHERADAMCQLSNAAFLSPMQNPAHEEKLCLDYIQLHEVNLAIDHCKAFLKLANSEPLLRDQTNQFARLLLEMKASLVPTRFEVSPPRQYSANEIKSFIHDKLGKQESSRVVNPFSCTADMAAWANHLTANAANDVQKAKALFDALTRHIDGLERKAHTASEVFELWDSKQVSFQCLDYTYFYVALARAVGLRAFFTDVSETDTGSTAPHACAGVFVDDKLILVDPKRCRFGAAHKRFELLNDLQAIAIYLSESAKIDQCRLAFRLAPELNSVRLSLAAALTNAGLWAEAEGLFRQIATFRQPTWLSLYARAVLTLHSNQNEASIALLQDATVRNPDSYCIYFTLGSAFAKHGELPCI